MPEPDLFHSSLTLERFKMWLERAHANGPVTDYNILELMILAFDHGILEERNK